MFCESGGAHRNYVWIEKSFRYVFVGVKYVWIEGEILLFVIYGFQFIDVYL